MELTWSKTASGHYFATNANGQRIATARKEATGSAWIGTVVGLGFTFGGRRLMDVKELAQRHVERIYGEGEWELFKAEDLVPGMVLGNDTWRGEEREVVSVAKNTDTQSVEVELTSESSRELGFNLDAEYAVGEYVRVRAVPTESVRAESLVAGDVIHFADGQATVTRVEKVDSSLSQLRILYTFRAANGATPACAVTVYPGSRYERTVKPAEETPETAVTEDAPAVEPGDVIRFYDCEATVTAVSESVVTFVRPDGTTGTKPVGTPLDVVGRTEEPAPVVETDGEEASPVLIPTEAVYLEPGDRVVTPLGTVMTVKRVRKTPGRPGHLTIICAEHFSFGRWADQEVMVTSFAAAPDEPLYGKRAQLIGQALRGVVA
ncbi:hypothetical protein SUDANB148_02961 [Streptomyces sp. SudanB148_2056]|uniref:hypothetical protein n=1 Tax=Streptomyces sp. SudanB148_2056 TaxID=3035280 RepID=UPI003F57CFC8